MPLSILHVQAGCSRDHTWQKGRESHGEILPDVSMAEAHLHHPSLEHGRQNELGVRRPRQLLHDVQTGVQVVDLQGRGITHNQAMLTAAGEITAVGREGHERASGLEAF